MYYVYLIQSVSSPDEKYVGLTVNLKKRLSEHNSGNSIHTNKFKPWKLVTYIVFTDKKKAKEFEVYIKQGSGHAFAKRHLW
ncbi:MAG: GIY-YIG nuclease family protein [Proteobacteria bacterium]|nr:GIY-YIG nuclease family protein [Pseudomonadota bacterium]MCH8322307.1 GIY-YIG nuclease family protein [Pseudomonadota bacterium]MCH8347506.1 GIY-YIG nuclease family protein [Pseudomonadota bacterium]